MAGFVIIAPVLSSARAGHSPIAGLFWTPTSACGVKL